MIEFHAALNLSFQAEDLQDAFTKLIRIVASRKNYVDTDDETLLTANGVEFCGMIDIHRADQCPYDPDEEEEKKEPWQQ